MDPVLLDDAGYKKAEDYINNVTKAWDGNYTDGATNIAAGFKSMKGKGYDVVILISDGKAYKADRTREQGLNRTTDEDLENTVAAARELDANIMSVFIKSQLPNDPSGYVHNSSRAQYGIATTSMGYLWFSTRQTPPPGASPVGWDPITKRYQSRLVGYNHNGNVRQNNVRPARLNGNQVEVNSVGSRWVEGYFQWKFVPKELVASFSSEVLEIEDYAGVDKALSTLTKGCTGTVMIRKELFNEKDTKVQGNDNFTFTASRALEKETARNNVARKTDLYGDVQFRYPVTSGQTDITFTENPVKNGEKYDMLEQTVGRAKTLARCEAYNAKTGEKLTVGYGSSSTAQIKVISDTSKNQFTIRGLGDSDRVHCEVHNKQQKKVVPSTTKPSSTKPSSTPPSSTKPSTTQPKPAEPTTTQTTEEEKPKATFSIDKKTVTSSPLVLSGQPRQRLTALHEVTITNTSNVAGTPEKLREAPIRPQGTQIEGIIAKPTGSGTQLLTNEVAMKRESAGMTVHELTSEDGDFREIKAGASAKLYVAVTYIVDEPDRVTYRGRNCSSSSQTSGFLNRIHVLPGEDSSKPNTSAQSIACYNAVFSSVNVSKQVGTRWNVYHDADTPEDAFALSPEQSQYFVRFTVTNTSDAPIERFYFKDYQVDTNTRERAHAIDPRTSGSGFTCGNGVSHATDGERIRVRRAGNPLKQGESITCTWTARGDAVPPPADFSGDEVVVDAIPVTPSFQTANGDQPVVTASDQAWVVKMPPAVGNLPRSGGEGVQNYFFIGLGLVAIGSAGLLRRRNAKSTGNK